MKIKKWNHINLGLVDYKPYIESFLDFDNSFNGAFIGIPKSLTKDQDFFGTLEQAKAQIPNILEKTTHLPTVVYMEGSLPFKKGEIFRRWIVEDGSIFFAPDSYASSQRPTYTSPIPKKFYEQIHLYRQAEISQFIDRVDEIPIINQNNMFLMGNSEGALSAARYNGSEFIGRIVISYSCEPGYYGDLPLIGADFSKDAFLNIMGTDDAYFSTKNVWNNGYNNKGNAADALFRFKNAKVVLLPSTGHDVTQNQFTKQEVLNFIKMFSRS